MFSLTKREIENAISVIKQHIFLKLQQILICLFVLFFVFVLLTDSIVSDRIDIVYNVMFKTYLIRVTLVDLMSFYCSFFYSLF